MSTPNAPNDQAKPDGKESNTVNVLSSDTRLTGTDPMARLFDEFNEDVDEDNTEKQPRLSFYYQSTSGNTNSNRTRVLDEIDKVEQLITLKLQKINENLMNSNNIINNKLVPSLEQFNKNSSKIYNNINHIKEFYENAANVNILTRKDIDEVAVNNSNLKNKTINAIDDTNLESKDRDDQNLSSELSEFTNIKTRYRKNLGTANNDNIKDFKNRDFRSVITTADGIISSPPRFLNSNGDTVNGNDDSNKQDFTDHFQIGIDDESTGRQMINQNIGPIRNSKTSQQPRSQSPEKRRIDFEKEPTKRYTNDVVTGYESPPWEEPPQLESTKFSIGSRKRRVDETDRVDSFLSNEEMDENMNRFIGGQNAEQRNNREEEQEEEEEVSIRFPSSPRYGAGGKLLRSEKGRQIALNFAKSEMIQNHPILSLNQQVREKNQSPTHKKLMDSKNKSHYPNNPLGVAFKDNNNDYNNSDSTFDEPPPTLMSEILEKRRE